MSRLIGEAHDEDEPQSCEEDGDETLHDESECCQQDTFSYTRWVLTSIASLSDPQHHPSD